MRSLLLACLVGIGPHSTRAEEEQRLQLEWDPISLSRPRAAFRTGSRDTTPIITDPFIDHAPLTAREAEIRQLLEACDQAMAIGDIAEATQRLQEARGLAPASDYLLLKSAQLHTLRRQYYLAEDDLLLLAERQPEQAEVFMLLGGVFLRLGRESEAATALDKALELEPNHLAARFHRACLDMLHQDTESARSRLHELNVEEYGQTLAWLAQEMAVLWDLLGPENMRQLGLLILSGGYETTTSMPPSFLEVPDPTVWEKRIGGIAISIREYLNAAEEANLSEALAHIERAKEQGALSPILDEEAMRWTTENGEII